MDRTLLGGTPGGGPGALRGVVPADVRGRGQGAGLHLGGRQRPALPDPPGRELRGAAGGARRGRTRCTGTTRGTARWWWRSGSSRCGWRWTSRSATSGRRATGLPGRRAGASRSGGRSERTGGPERGRSVPWRGVPVPADAPLVGDQRLRRCWPSPSASSWGPGSSAGSRTGSTRTGSAEARPDPASESGRAARLSCCRWTRRRPAGRPRRPGGTASSSSCPSRELDGRRGSYVLTLLRTDSGKALPVVRGWLAGTAGPSRRPRPGEVR